MNDWQRIKEIIKILNAASNCYYNSSPIMSDYDWDILYDELLELENKYGVVFNNSPTHKVGYTVSDGLKKVKHNHPMLSLDKTKHVNDLVNFTVNQTCMFSVKCDGLTMSLRYVDGELVSAETRGDGTSGVDVLQNALTISNIPKRILYKDELIVDGEVIVRWDVFSKINNTLDSVKNYKHPRNLVSGSLQCLDSKQAAKRGMSFVAWRVIGNTFCDSVSESLNFLRDGFGFQIVPFVTYQGNDLNAIEYILSNLREAADIVNIPYDGVVVSVDSYENAEKMGRTEKAFQHSIAYKFEDSMYETTLRDVEWNTSKTGVINPVAIFDPVDLDGAVTMRATLHNISYIKKLQLGIGDRIRVYRSNMVIPKVHDSIDKTNNVIIPQICPICGGVAEIVKDNDSEVLRCMNPDCSGKLLGKLRHAVSRNALNIDGLSRATIEKFIDKNWLQSIRDIYYLNNFSHEIMNFEGFGRQSTNNLMKAIEYSRHTTLDRFIYSLSIPLIGKTASRSIAMACDYDVNVFFEDMENKGAKFYDNLSGIGATIIQSLDSYYNEYKEEMKELAKEFTFEKPVSPLKMTGVSKDLTGKTFVITGKLETFPNRDAAKDAIESLGGKVSGSVTAKTSYLVNNDKASTSSKNKKAKELNIPIISEKELLSMIA